MDTTNWQWFKIGDLFDEPYKAQAYNAIELQECSPGNYDAILYVTRTDTNNGCKAFVVNNNFEFIEQGNAITIGDTTSTIYYQEQEFICGDHIVVLRSKYLNKYIGIFIASLLNKERFRFCYGRAFKKDIIKTTKIKLPAKDNKPDWDYIEKFVKESIIPKLPKKSFDVWNNILDTSPIIRDKYSLNTDNWQWFTLGNLFDIKKGHEIIKELTRGEIPLISAKYGNNGVDSLVYSPTEIFDGDVITTSSNGKPGISYYQQNKFCATSDINILTPKFKMSSYICLFISTVIENETYRFNYGRKWGKSKMEIHKIKLPATQDGEPDWEFMENYIKSLPYSRMI